jgi:hypothetical protein
MKDYVRGSKEFLIKYYELLERQLATCIPLNNQTDISPSSSRRRSTIKSSTSSQAPHSQMASRPITPVSHHEPDLQIDDHEEDIDLARKSINDGLSAHDVNSGLTDLHFTHNQKEKKITNVSKRLYHLKVKMSTMNFKGS